MLPTLRWEERVYYRDDLRAARYAAVLAFAGIPATLFYSGLIETISIVGSAVVALILISLSYRQ